MSLKITCFVTLPSASNPITYTPNFFDGKYRSSKLIASGTACKLSKTLPTENRFWKYVTIQSNQNYYQLYPYFLNAISTTSEHSHLDYFIQSRCDSDVTMKWHQLIENYNWKMSKKTKRFFISSEITFLNCWIYKSSFSVFVSATLDSRNYQK